MWKIYIKRHTGKKTRPVQEYLADQGRFNHLMTDFIREIQKQTDAI
ncbi:MAG: hypothetical protein ACE5R6_14920 [Candidatus Heimdallarchaeota archaeon]